jgi:hypothetical protein
MALDAVTNSGQQTASGSPQAAGQPSTGAAPASGVQPGTAASLLNGPGSIQLSTPQLTTVSLGAGSSATISSQPPKLKHHVNATLLVICGLVLLLAIGLVWQMTRSAKSTT